MTTLDTTHPNSAHTIITPTPRHAFRAARFWLLGGVAVIILAIITLALQGDQTAGSPLSLTSAAPAGAKAVAEVLRQRGVTVKQAESLSQAKAAVTDASNTTLVLYDSESYLSDQQLRQVSTLADTIVLVTPGFAELQEIAPEVASAGDAHGPWTADCPISEVQRAQSVSGDGLGYRIVDASSDATGCLSSAQGVYSLVVAQQGSRTISVLGVSSVLSNESIPNAGNAAFALGLLGAHPTLVWYTPTIADLDGEPKTLADFAPQWVIPVAGLLFLTAIAAIIWRSRRMGALVIENLPVTVRSSETMEGRARLYAKGNARLRALDALRLGTVGRIAVLCGLPRSSSLDDIIVSAAAAIGDDSAGIRGILVDAVPASDRDLVRLSDELVGLERRVRAAVQPR